MRCVHAVWQTLCSISSFKLAGWPHSITFSAAATAGEACVMGAYQSIHACMAVP